jgi:hypothetical protein
MAEYKFELRHAKPSFSSLNELKKVTGNHSPLWVITKFGEGVNLLLNRIQMGLGWLYEPKTSETKTEILKADNTARPKKTQKKIATEKDSKQNLNYFKANKFSSPLNLGIFKKFYSNNKHALVPLTFWKGIETKSKIKSTPKTLIPKEVIQPNEIRLGFENSINAPLVSLDASTINLLHNFKRGMRLLQFGILLVFVLMGVQTFLILTNQSINFQATATNQTLSTVSSLPVNSEPGLRIITNFTTNQGVIDIGYSLDVQKEVIKMKNTSNCKTPGVPPLQNGCNVTILPGALGIPARGTIYKNIQFEGKIPKDSKIKMDIKDFETGEVGQDLGSFGPEKLGKNIPIPSNISNTQGIYLRLWTLGGEISITKVAIEYYNVEQVKPVSGKINPELLKDITSFKIWEDKDQNRLWDPKNDVEWTCRPNFPGVLPLEFGVNGNFVATRDDACFTDIKPDKWYIDKGTNVLPNGMWLIVSQDPQIAVSFEVKASNEKVILDIESFDKVNYK